MDIVYHKMSLFDAPANACLAHATNCQGRWGSGIAKEFAKRFPKANAGYSEACKRHGRYLLGKSLFVNTQESTQSVICLFTSFDYGERKDSPAEILKNTRGAVEDIVGSLDVFVKYPLEIYSNKFNSGLFAVPWSETARILEDIKSDIVWHVCDNG